MAVALTFRDTVSAVETVADAYAASTDNTVTQQLNTSLDLTGATTPPVTKVAIGAVALAAGAATIDLTALTGLGTGGSTVNASGLKLQVAKFRGKSTNSSTITIVTGASNGYDLSGAAASITLQPAQEVTFYFKDLSPDVAAGDKTIDLSGTGTDVLELIMVFG